MTAVLDNPPKLEIPADISPGLTTATAPLIRYSITDAWIAQAERNFASLEKPEEVRQALTTMVKARTTIDKERKLQNELAREHIRNVDNAAKAIIAKMAPTEQQLQAKWDAIEAERERKRREAEEARQRAINEEIEKRRQEQEAALKAEQDRLAKERAELEALQKRLAEQEAAAKAKADEEARIAREQEEKARAERERIAAEKQAEERRRFEEQQKAERERQAKVEAEHRAERERLAAEQAKLEAERKAVEEAKRQAAAEAEAKAAAERKRLADEQAAREEEERKAAHAKRMEELKPDREKINAFAGQIRALGIPKVKDKEAATVVLQAAAVLEQLAKDLTAYGAGDPVMPYRTMPYSVVK